MALQWCLELQIFVGGIQVGFCLSVFSLNLTPLQIFFCLWLRENYIDGITFRKSMNTVREPSETDIGQKVEVAYQFLHKYTAFVLRCRSVGIQAFTILGHDPREKREGEQGQGTLWLKNKHFCHMMFKMII